MCGYLILNLLKLKNNQKFNSSDTLTTFCFQDLHVASAYILENADREYVYCYGKFY